MVSPTTLSRAELRALPPVIDLETAGRALGLKRSTTYVLAKRGELPVRALRLGRAYRVVSAELLEILGVTPDSDTEPAPGVAVLDQTAVS
ncbi:helix-turn-helix transcriptional regulator [Streptomyces luteireticuli]|uniref:helix-turn-helix transcriptional regulator n=1 Tax=Streptomyces luteireticuli TaxID=173858 RepID=UPI003558E083